MNRAGWGDTDGLLGAFKCLFDKWGFSNIQMKGGTITKMHFGSRMRGELPELLLCL